MVCIFFPLDILFFLLSTLFLCSKQKGFCILFLGFFFNKKELEKKHETYLKCREQKNCRENVVKIAKNQQKLHEYIRELKKKELERETSCGFYVNSKFRYSTVRNANIFLDF